MMDKIELDIGNLKINQENIENYTTSNCGIISSSLDNSFQAYSSSTSNLTDVKNDKKINVIQTVLDNKCISKGKSEQNEGTQNKFNQSHSDPRKQSSIIKIYDRFSKKGNKKNPLARNCYFYNTKPNRHPKCTESIPENLTTCDKDSTVNNQIPPKESAYLPNDILWRDYVVTYVSGFVGINIQNSEQQHKYRMLRSKLDKFSNTSTDHPISSISSDKKDGLVYLFKYAAGTYRVQIIKPLENKAANYLCIDIDTGKLHHVELKHLYKLPEEFKNVEKLSVFRYLKSIRVAEDYRKHKESRSKIYLYVSELLENKLISIENINHQYIDIYHGDQHLNPIILEGIKNLFIESPPADLTFNYISQHPSYEIDKTFVNHHDNLETLDEVPTTVDNSKNMIVLKKMMINQNNSTRTEDGTDSGFINNFSSMVDLIFKNFHKRDAILRKLSESSSISLAIQYIFQNYLFYTEIDKVIAKGKDILTKSAFTSTAHRRHYPVEKNIANFYMMERRLNNPDVEKFLNTASAGLVNVCSENEIITAKQGGKFLSMMMLDSPFDDFINEYNSWKDQYSECLEKTDELLNTFLSEQTLLIKSLENLLRKNFPLTSKIPVDHVQMLYDQLIIEENLSKENWVAISILMINDEMRRRLNKIEILKKISARIDNLVESVRYQGNSSNVKNVQTVPK